MGFFAAADDSEMQRHRQPPEPEWHRIPLEYLPTPLTTSELLAHGTEIALVLSTILVYPTGFLFTIRSARHPEALSHDHDLTADMNGFSNPMSGNRFRLGIEYADGRRATNDHLGPSSANPEANLRGMGGSGSADGVAVTYWAWPLPAEGDVDLVYAWPVRGIEEARYTVPGDVLRAAAAQARPIWPDTTGGGAAS